MGSETKDVMRFSFRRYFYPLAMSRAMLVGLVLAVFMLFTLSEAQLLTPTAGQALTGTLNASRTATLHLPVRDAAISRGTFHVAVFPCSGRFNATLKSPQNEVIAEFAQPLVENVDAHSAAATSFTSVASNVAFTFESKFAQPGNYSLEIATTSKTMPLSYAAVFADTAALVATAAPLVLPIDRTITASSRTLSGDLKVQWAAASNRPGAGTGSISYTVLAFAIEHEEATSGAATHSAAEEEEEPLALLLGSACGAQSVKSSAAATMTLIDT